MAKTTESDSAKQVNKIIIVRENKNAQNLLTLSVNNKHKGSIVHPFLQLSN